MCCKQCSEIIFDSLFFLRLDDGDEAFDDTGDDDTGGDDGDDDGGSVTSIKAQYEILMERGAFNFLDNVSENNSPSVLLFRRYRATKDFDSRRFT